MNVPGLPCEDAIDEQMLHGLALLVAEQTAVFVGPVTPHELICSSAAIEASQPNKEVCLVRCPCLPVLPSGIGLDHAMEERLIVPCTKKFSVLINFVS